MFNVDVAPALAPGPFGSWGPSVRVEHEIDPNNDAAKGLLLIVYFHRLVPGGFPAPTLFDRRLTAECTFLRPIRKGQEAHARWRILSDFASEYEVALVTGEVALRVFVRPKILN